jgi:hypothetical protein
VRDELRDEPQLGPRDATAVPILLALVIRLQRAKGASGPRKGQKST